MFRTAAIVLFAFLVGPACAQPQSASGFQLPLACANGSCAVQNFADLDPTAGASDPQCGRLTYDGHDGLDFRVTGAAARAGVDVLAIADGVVRAARDGEADGVYRASGAAASVADRECGNGVVIEHADGWSSQLCHMRRGSIRVQQGQRISAGQALGQVGLSGFTQFPHVHLTLRRNNEKVEPITGGSLTATRCSAQGLAPGAQWSSQARAQLAYRGTQWFEAGFMGNPPPEGAAVDTFEANASRNAPAFVFWALAIAPRNGDVLKLRLYGPDGALLAEGERVQSRDQAQAWLFAGRRTPAGGWPAGLYRGEAQILRGGRVVEEMRAEQRL